MERPADEISYTPSQLRAYLEHIDLCSDASDFPEPSIPWLEKLIRHHISSIPFENLAMHYSKTHLLDLDPVNLYTKVIKRGFGGGCTELNRMFGLLMKGLGFEVTMHGARVHAAAGGGEGDWYFGWTHMVNLVHLNGNNYLVDVAFGGLGPVKPLLLEPNSIASGVGNQQYRLSKEVVKSQGQAEGLWIYQQRTSNDQPFAPVYAFASIPFLPQDYDIITWYCETNKVSWFTQKIVCMKYILKDEELVGSIIMDQDIFFIQKGGEKETLTKAKNEVERITALKKYFGFSMTAEERNGILKLPSKL